MISLQCPLCLKERTVRVDGVGKLCRDCFYRDIANKRHGKSLIPMIGKKFGRLTVLSLEPRISKYFRWKCQCDCGNTAVVLGSVLRLGSTKSCGCLRSSLNGFSETKKSTYKTYRSMLLRCYCKTAVPYKNYGLKGIIVCDRWRESFFNFLEDMGERPDGKTLDRIDCKGNYFKENCRWSTLKEQARNTSRNHFITAFGATKTLTDFSLEYSLDLSTLSGRLRKGWAPEEALTLPKGVRFKK